MKRPVPFFQRGHVRPGIALIMTLVMTTLMSILVIAILTVSRGERAAATIYSDGLSARQLYDTGVNALISQLRIGTLQNSESDETEVWISQPGAIRRYDTNGNFTLGARLYSDEQMVVRDEQTFSFDLPPADWDSDDFQAHYVDLNQPIQRERDLFPNHRSPRSRR